MNDNDNAVDAGRRLYYSSSQGPFYNANNIYMFYGGGNRGNIVERTIRSVKKGEPVVHVHGEAGSGKTITSLVISDRIKHSFHTMRYDLPAITAPRLLRHLLIELVPQSSDTITAEQAQLDASQSDIEGAIACIERQLESSCQSKDNKPYILIIDSKGSLDADTLEVIETLTAFKVNDKPVIHCVVFHTADNNVERYVTADGTTAQKADNHFWLRRLTLSEINEYLRHHMMLYDFNRRDLFTREMAYFIADRSEGVFKSINTLSRNAFTIANLEEADKLSMSHLLMAGLPVVEEPVSRLEFMARYRRLATVALMSTCAFASMGLMLYLVV